MEKVRIDYLANHKDYKVAQHEDMYHFNTDTCLLGEFIKIKENEQVLDVGTNNGALLVYIINKGGIATGIEIVEEALEICKITLKENNFNATLINQDFTNFDSKNFFDVIVSNPPYFTNNNSNEENNNQFKNSARHEKYLNLEGLCKGISKNLKNTGRIYLVYKAFRFLELEKFLNKYNLYINKYQIVYDSLKKNPKSVLVEASFVKTEKEQLENLVISH